MSRARSRKSSACAIASSAALVAGSDCSANARIASHIEKRIGPCRSTRMMFFAARSTTIARASTSFGASVTADWSENVPRNTERQRRTSRSAGCSSAKARWSAVSGAGRRDVVTCASKSGPSNADATRAAASSIASGTPARRREISAMLSRSRSFGEKPVMRARTRSTKISTASASSTPPSSTRRSIATPSGTRLVTRNRTPGVLTTHRRMIEAAAGRRCSMLSRMTSAPARAASVRESAISESAWIARSPANARSTVAVMSLGTRASRRSQNQTLVKSAARVCA